MATYYRQLVVILKLEMVESALTNELPLGIIPATLAVEMNVPSVSSKCPRAAYASHRCVLTLSKKHLSQSSS